MFRLSPAALLGVTGLPLALPIAVLQGVLVLGWVLPAAVIPILVLDLLGTAQNVSIFFFGVGFVGLAGALAMPWLVHHAGRRAMVAIGGACIVVSSLLMSLGEVVSLVIGAAIRAFGFLCLDVAFEITVMERIPRRDLARFEPVRMFFMGIGLVIGPWLGIRLWLDVGLWCPFAILALLTAAVCVYVLRAGLTESPRGAPPRGRPPNPLRFIARFLGQPRLRLAWVLAFGRSAWWTMYFIYAPIYCVQSGLGEQWAGIILSAGSAAILLVPLWGRLGRHIGMRALVAGGYLSTGVVTIGVAVVADLPWLGVGLLLAASVCAAVIDAVGNALFLRAVHPHERTEMASLFTTYRETAHMAPPGVFSVLLGIFALPAVFVVSGASLVLLTWLTRYIPRRY